MFNQLTEVGTAAGSEGEKSRDAGGNTGLSLRLSVDNVATSTCIYNVATSTYIRCRWVSGCNTRARVKRVELPTSLHLISNINENHQKLHQPT